ncbi:hypothetical protein VTK26DRAFT_3184 [Humicola hyalothermophila]
MDRGERLPGRSPRCCCRGQGHRSATTAWAGSSGSLAGGVSGDPWPPSNSSAQFTRLRVTLRGPSSYTKRSATTSLQNHLNPRFRFPPRFIGTTGKQAYRISRETTATKCTV